MVSFSVDRFLSLAPAALSVAPHGVLALLGFALAACAAIFIAIRSYRDTEPSLEAGPRRLLITLRLLVLWGLLVVLAEPVLDRREVIRRDPAVLLLVDDSASMDLRGPDGRRRLAEAADRRSELARRLAERREPLRLLFGEGARRLTRSGPVPPDSLRVGPHADGTDLGALILSAAQQTLDENLVAIVLFSDGRSTGTRSAPVGGLDVPVFTVAIGDTLAPVDLRVDRVRHPRFVHRGDRIRIDAEIVAEASEAVRRTLVLEMGEGPVDSLELRWAEGGGRRAVHFELRADSLGLQRGRLRVRPLPNESLLANNTAEIGFEVRQARLRVVHLQEHPDWNFHFLARQVAADPRLEWVGLYRTERGWQRAGSDSTWSWPLPAAFREEVDLWSAGSLADAVTLLGEGTGVVESVRAGAGLWVLAGDGASRPPTLPPAVAALLPLRPDPRAFWRGGEIGTRVTAAGRRHPILALDEVFGSAEQAVRLLPPLRRVLQPVRVAPDADVLLEAEIGPARQPLLALREEGRGRVAMAIGSPFWSWSFWRLGEETGAPVARQWMSQLLSHLAEGGGGQRLRLFLPGAVVPQGADARAEAVVLDAQQRPDPRTDVWLEWKPVDSAEGAVQRARMLPSESNAGGRALPLPALPPGDYAFRVSLEEDDHSLSTPWQRLAVDPYSVEYRAPGLDRAALAELARRTGGRLLSPEEFAPWAASLPLPSQERVLTGRLDLWASWWLLLPWLALLSAEWALRKRWGLL